jgi:glycosyltransferase involved in cell wall biosynthesis
MTPRILRKALMVITVSRSSADELLRRFDVPPDKVHVVYNSIPAALLPEGEVPKEKMVLHVGSFSDRKNVPFIIEAFRRSGRSDLRLVLCGSPQRQLRYKATMAAEDANIEVHTGLSDQELGRLYAKASYIVCASHYEGFGMPVLEGIAHGAIPLLSDISVFRELYPKGPLFFSPLRPEELEAIFATLPDQYADPMPEIRKEYLKTFAHSRSVGVMAELMEELLHA